VYVASIWMLAQFEISQTRSTYLSLASVALPNSNDRKRISSIDSNWHAVDGAADHGCASATLRVHGHALGSEFLRALLGLELAAGYHR